MMRLAVLLVALGSMGMADTLVATRTIPARAVIGPDDLALRDGTTPGGISDIEVAVGQEARVALYAGRPIRRGDIGAPSVVERNQIVPLIYQNGAIAISTEGRALDRAGPGDLIRVMNLASRATVSARIDANGNAYVRP